MRLLLGIVSILVLACDPAPREVTAPNAGAPSAPAPSLDIQAASPSMVPSDATTPPVAPSTAARFPALDDSCKSDTDCVLFEDEIADAPPHTYACCSGCVQRAANKNWLAQFRSFCRGFSPPSCPPIGCAMLIQRPVCQAGHCRAQG